MKRIFFSYTVSAEVLASYFIMRHIESGKTCPYSQLTEEQLDSGDWVPDNLQEAAENAEKSEFDSEWEEVD